MVVRNMKYYNRTNTCDCECKCENKLLSQCTYRQINKEGNWTGKWLCVSCRRGYHSRQVILDKLPVGNDINDSKKLKHNPMSKEFQDECKKLGLTGNQFVWYKKLESKYGNEFAEFAIKNECNIDKKYLNYGCKNSTEYYNKRIQKLGFKDRLDYENRCSQRLGYKDRNERYREKCYNKGIFGPMSENEGCADYFGKYIGEELFKRFLSTIFEHVEHMNYKNKGFDFICKNPRQEFINIYQHLMLERNKEYRIQLKMKCLVDQGRYWKFWIEHNNIIDYFILVGWDNREYLNILHIWIFHKDNIVKEEKFWKRDSVTITNKPEYLAKFGEYKLKNEKVPKELLQKLKEEFGINKKCNDI